MQVLAADPIADAGIEILARDRRADVRTGLTRHELVALAGGYGAIILRSQTIIDASILATSPMPLLIERPAGITQGSGEHERPRGVLGPTQRLVVIEPRADLRAVDRPRLSNGAPAVPPAGVPAGWTTPTLLSASGSKLT